jgi:hypothetical protein
MEVQHASTPDQPSPIKAASASWACRRCLRALRASRLTLGRHRRYRLGRYRLGRYRLDRYRLPTHRPNHVHERAGVGA